MSFFKNHSKMIFKKLWCLNNQFVFFDSTKKVIPKAAAKTIIPITKYNMVF